MDAQLKAFLYEILPNVRYVYRYLYRAVFDYIYIIILIIESKPNEWIVELPIKCSVHAMKSHVMKNYCKYNNNDNNDNNNILCCVLPHYRVYMYL